MFPHDKPTRSAVLLVLAVAAIMVAGIAISSYQRQLGIAEASSGSIAAIAAVERAVHLLGEGDDLHEYQAAMRVALVARRRMVLLNPVDTEVRGELDTALGYLTAAREAWLARADGAWDPVTYGSAMYWRARLDDPAFLATAGSVELEEVLRTCAEEADAAVGAAHATAGIARSGR